VVGVRQVLGVLGICGAADVLDYVYLVVAAEMELEVRWAGLESGMA
jgi:hypothetical protein